MTSPATAEQTLDMLIGMHQPDQVIAEEGEPFRYCRTCGSGEPHEYPTEWPCATHTLLMRLRSQLADTDPLDRSRQLTTAHKAYEARMAARADTTRTAIPPRLPLPAGFEITAKHCGLAMPYQSGTRHGEQRYVCARACGAELRITTQDAP